MTWLAELMPLFLIRWYAGNNCERETMHDWDLPLIYTCPRRGVFIVDWERTIAEREKAKLREGLKPCPNH